MRYTDDIFPGEIGIELETAGTKVSEYLAAHEDVFAGGHYTSDCSHFSVSIAKPLDPAVQGLHELISTLGDQSQFFIFEQVEKSWTELSEIQMQIVSHFMVDWSPSSNGQAVRKGTTLHAVGHRDSPSRVTVEVIKDPGGAPLEQNAEVRAINALFPGAVMFMEVCCPIGGVTGQP